MKKVAEDLGITPAQAIISWHVQRGVVVLPKSVHEDRIQENFKSTCRISETRPLSFYIYRGLIASRLLYSRDPPSRAV